MRKLKVLALMVLVSVSVWGQEEVKATRLKLINESDSYVYSKNSIGEYHHIGTYPGWDREGIYIAGYNNTNLSHIRTKRVYIGKSIVFDLTNNKLTTSYLKLNENASIRLNRYFGYEGSSDNVHRIFLKRDNLKALSGGSLLPYSDGISIESDALITFIETDQDLVRGWMDVNNNRFIWSGNVGIGTTNPQSKLSVEGGDVHIGKEVNSNGQRRQLRIYGHDSGAQFFGSLHSNYDNNIRTFDISTNSVTQQIKIDGSANNYGRILLMPGGNTGVGIGTTNPKAKLDVAGNIKAEEIEVTLASIDDMQLNGTLAANNITLTANGNTADFVFADSYQLTPLSEVESFIKTNKHLPEIPSAAQMEEQGVNLAEMNKLLLQKVEELTLYAIEKDKRIEKIEEERNKEKEERKKLEERLAKLEALLLKEE